MCDHSGRSCSLISEHSKNSPNCVAMICAMLLMKMREFKQNTMERNVKKSTTVQNCYIYAKELDNNLDKFFLAEVARGCGDWMKAIKTIFILIHACSMRELSLVRTVY